MKIQQEELELALDIVQRSEGFTEKTIKHGSEVEIYIHVEKSSITDFESNDIVEMYLDNQYTRESDIWCGKTEILFHDSHDEPWRPGFSTSLEGSEFI